MTQAGVLQKRRYEAGVATSLIDMQMLLPGEDGRLMRKAPRAIPRRPRLYTVNIARVMAYKPD